MSGPNRRTAWPLSAALLLATATGTAAQDAGEILRDRQERVSNLEYAIKEAELVRRLCDVAPYNSECASGQTDDPPHLSQPGSALSFRLIEVFGSEGRLQAVLEDSEGKRRIVQTGAEFAPGLILDRVRLDSVDVLTQLGVSTLRIGDD